jgi:hypothetical protein
VPAVSFFSPTTFARRRAVRVFVSLGEPAAAVVIFLRAQGLRAAILPTFSSRSVSPCLAFVGPVLRLGTAAARVLLNRDKCVRSREACAPTSPVALNLLPVLDFSPAGVPFDGIVRSREVCVVASSAGLDFSAGSRFSARRRAIRFSASLKACHNSALFSVRLKRPQPLLSPVCAPLLSGVWCPMLFSFD